MNQGSAPFSIRSSTREFNLTHGFLPEQDPLMHLPPAFAEWERLAEQLPKILTTPLLQESLQTLPNFPIHQLKTPSEFERAMMLLSYLGQAYVWSSKPTVQQIPAVLAKPWYAVASQVGRPPILSYASYALYNWRRIEKNKPIELGNIALLQNFLGGLDEEWFILVHVDIEAKAIPGLNAIIPLQQAIKHQQLEAVTQHLETIFQTLQAMCHTLRRMPENCDPYIYYNRVRPYIHGWKDNPALPNGLIYEDVFDNQPQFFKGETGAQSTIIPVFDSTFGIDHADNPLKAHLEEMKIYMPPDHRTFLANIAEKMRTREYVKKSSAQNPQLKTLYNECVKLIFEFRRIHLNYATQYIQNQHQTSIGNPTMVGTGGTPFIQYLGKHLKETDKYLL